jgi:TetR/AcrR family transcriptional regulator, tetracycline repressor protein
MGVPTSRRNKGVLGRPSRLSKDQVIVASLKLLDLQGLEGFSMAKLATELGVGVMTIYHYFPSRTDLLDAVSASLFVRFEAPDPDPDWAISIGHWVKAVYAFFSDNPIALDLIRWEAHVTPAWLRVSLPMLRTLASGGFSSQALAFASRWLVSVVLGVVAAQRETIRSSNEKILPQIPSLSAADRALISDINRYYYTATESTLIDFVADNLVSGLRKLHPACGARQ